jgi:uncharacterized membrane protein
MSAISLKTIALSTMFGAAAMVAGSSLAVAADEGKMGVDKPGMEHCYGVAKAGKNDCATAAHSCAGQTTKDNDKTSWISIPVGVCAKLAGGSTTKM